MKQLHFDEFRGLNHKDLKEVTLRSDKYGYSSSNVFTVKISFEKKEMGLYGKCTGQELNYFLQNFWADTLMGLEHPFPLAPGEIGFGYIPKLVEGWKWSKEPEFFTETVLIG